MAKCGRRISSKSLQWVLRCHFLSIRLLPPPHPSIASVSFEENTQKKAVYVIVMKIKPRTQIRVISVERSLINFHSFDCLIPRHRGFFCRRLVSFSLFFALWNVECYSTFEGWIQLWWSFGWRLLFSHSNSTFFFTSGRGFSEVIKIWKFIEEFELWDSVWRETKKAFELYKRLEGRSEYTQRRNTQF